MHNYFGSSLKSGCNKKKCCAGNFNVRNFKLPGSLHGVRELPKLIVDLYLQGLLKKHEVFETDFQVHRDRCSEVQKEGEKLMEEVSGRFDMSHVATKPVFRVSDKVQHKPGCTATEDG